MAQDSSGKFMAEELLQHTMAVNAVTASFESGAKFTNTTSSDLFIREMLISCQGQGDAGANFHGFVEVSKSPKRESQVDESTEWKKRLSYGQQSGDAALSGALGVDRLFKWAKGQVRLEPNESLYVHGNILNTDSLDIQADLDYHF